MISDLLNSDFKLLKCVSTPDGVGGSLETFNEDISFKGDLQVISNERMIQFDGSGRRNITTLFCEPITISDNDRIKELKTGYIYKINNIVPVRQSHLEISVEKI
jgi:hypothetical protein